MSLTLAMLDVIAPDTLVDSPICAVENPVSIRLVVLELSFVVVAVRMPECAFSVRFIVLPLALVLGAVLPDLDAVAVSHAPSPVIHLVAVDRLHACVGALAHKTWRRH